MSKCLFTNGPVRASALLALMILLLLPASGEAQEAAAGFDLAGGPVKITSDNLVMRQRERHATFSGNVHAVQEKTTVTSKTLDLYFKESGGEPSPDQGQGAGFGALDRIVASGSVLVETEAYTARSDEAVFRVDDDVLVLSGDPVVLTQGENSVKGKTVTIDRKAGTTTVTGGADRVEVDFSPKEENPPSPAPKTAP